MGDLAPIIRGKTNICKIIKITSLLICTTKYKYNLTVQTTNTILNFGNLKIEKRVIRTCSLSMASVVCQCQH